MRWMLLSALLLTGCPKGKKLEAALAEQQVQNTELQAQVDGLKAEVAARDTSLATLQSEADGVSAELAACQAAVTEAEALLSEEHSRNARLMGDQDTLESEIEAMKAAMRDLEERKRAADQRVAEFREMVARFKTLIDAGTLEVKIANGRMVLAMNTDILFASGSATLSADGKQALTEVATVLAGMPDKAFQVEGYTDNVPIRSKQYPSNWYLASGRAIGVVDHLISAGMAASQLSGASYGDQHPVAPNETKEGRSANRRIEIVVVPDLSDLPGFDELTAISEGKADSGAGKAE